MYAILLKLDKAKFCLAGTESTFLEAKRDIEKFLHQHEFFQRDTNCYVCTQDEIFESDALEIINQMSKALPWLKHSYHFIRLFEISQDIDASIAL